MKKTLIALFLVMFSLSFIPFSDADDSIFSPYIIDGNTVYINDSKAFISVTPHTITKSEWITVELMSKHFTGDITVVLGFNGSSMHPEKWELYSPWSETIQINYTCDGTFNYTLNPNHFQCWQNGTDLAFEHDFDGGNIPLSTAWWNVRINHTWRDINKPVGTINHLFDDKTTWKYSANNPITVNETVKFRILMQRPWQMPSGEDKYDLAFFPSSYGSDIQQAISDGNLYLLDPWTGYENCSSDPSDYVIFEDFETARTSNWTGDSESCTWQDSTDVMNGTYSLRCPTANDREKYDEPDGSYSIEMWIKSAGGLNTWGAWHTNTDYPLYLIKDTGTVYFYIDAVNRASSSYTDQWYKFRWQQDETSGTKMSVWMYNETGSLLDSDINRSYTQEATSVAKIGNGAGSGDSHFDDFRAWSGIGSCPAAGAPPVTGDSCDPPAGSNPDWLVNGTDYCEINDTDFVTTGKITFNGSPDGSGSFGRINITNSNLTVGDSEVLGGIIVVLTGGSILK